MPRPSSGLVQTQILLSPADREALDRIAQERGLVTDGRPSRSAAVRWLLAAAQEHGLVADRRPSRSAVVRGRIEAARRELEAAEAALAVADHPGRPR